MPQTQAQVAQEKQAAKKKVGDAFSDAATPLNWQCDDHPAYKCDDLPEGLSAFLRNRYKHWAPKVMWVVRLWASLCTLDSLFRM